VGTTISIESRYSPDIMATLRRTVVDANAVALMDR
jgi:hypothetical protein